MRTSEVEGAGQLPWSLTTPNLPPIKQWRGLVPRQELRQAFQTRKRLLFSHARKVYAHFVASRKHVEVGQVNRRSGARVHELHLRSCGAAISRHVKTAWRGVLAGGERGIVDLTHLGAQNTLVNLHAWTIKGALMATGQ